jgi:hypothetical protein
MMVHQRITSPMWETISMFTSLEDGEDEQEVWTIHLTTSDFYLPANLNNTVHAKNSRTLRDLKH